MDRDCQAHTHFIWDNIIAAITDSTRRLHTNDVWLGEGAWSQGNQYPNDSDNATRTPHINYLKIPIVANMVGILDPTPTSRSDGGHARL